MSTFERTMSRGLSFCAAFGAFLFFATAAQAAPDFPTLIQGQLNLPCVPACTVCHQDLNGGFGTVVKPFGMALRADGLMFTDATVAPAFMKLEADKTDSNSDGIPDVIQLSAGVDPNTGKSFCGTNAPLTPQYGCGAHIANAPAPDHSAPIAALLAAAVLGASAHRSARRRRRAGG